jgi:hypothetical protein
LADFDDAAGERDPGKGDDQARAKMSDTAVNGDQKQRADHVEQGDGTGDQADRPAVRLDHLMKIHPRAKQAERISE